jgi:hypothetical protein
VVARPRDRARAVSTRSEALPRLPGGAGHGHSVLLARRALRERLELRPHDRRVDAPVERPLREAAIRSGEHALAPDELAVADDGLGDELGMFHHIGGVTDDARDQRLACRQLHLLPHFPKALAERLCRLI